MQCDQCEGWVHQICGLFNKGRNDQNRGFLCPFCLRDGGWVGGSPWGTAGAAGAAAAAAWLLLALLAVVRSRAKGV